MLQNDCAVHPLVQGMGCTLCCCMQVHMDAGDYAGLIAATQRYGDASRGGDPQLWSEVLEYFVRQPSEECRAAVRMGCRMGCGCRMGYRNMRGIRDCFGAGVLLGGG